MINGAVKREFVGNADMDVQKGIAVSEYVRNETLSRVYSISGYVGMPTDERNRLYDMVRDEVVAELAAIGVAF